VVADHVGPGHREDKRRKTEEGRRKESPENADLKRSAAGRVKFNPGNRLSISIKKILPVFLLVFCLPSSP
jgi:hypothetical protein